MGTVTDTVQTTRLAPARKLANDTRCCSEFYEQDWVRFLAEDCFHPGGTALTRRTIEGMGLSSGASVLDLGCGTGTTANTLAKEFGYTVTGLDSSERNIATARILNRNDQIRFVAGDAYGLPFSNESFDGIVAECVLSVFADKVTALAELKRVLKPGGKIGITDMSVARTLPDEFAQAVAPWTCLAAAPSAEEYKELFLNSGFQILATADESESLSDTVRHLKRRLLLAGTGGLAAGHIPFDITTVRHWIDRFDAEVGEGSISYLRFQLKS